MRLYVEGVGLRGPGLDCWAAGVPILTGAHDYVATPTRLPLATLLPANERRRAVQTVKIALAVGEEALTAAHREPDATVTVFASSGADGDTIHDILSVLASADRAVSPTRFHNSVHNAPAGYWSIATGSTAASTSLCCHDDSFAAGLLEASVQACVERYAVALIAYDAPYPPPLHEKRPLGAAFGVALVLAPEPTPAVFASIEVILEHGAAATTLAPAELEVLRNSMPAARSLPLLSALARQVETRVTIRYMGDRALGVTVHPVPRKDGYEIGMIAEKQT
jgi:hypothetical protein